MSTQKIRIRLKAYDHSLLDLAVAEIVDTTKLLPEYLMMWMSRSEFDREACFYAVGGVRGSLEWEDFCNMKLLATVRVHILRKERRRLRQIRRNHFHQAIQVVLPLGRNRHDLRKTQARRHRCNAIQ